MVSSRFLARIPTLLGPRLHAPPATPTGLTCGTGILFPPLKHATRCLCASLAWTRDYGLSGRFLFSRGAQGGRAWCLLSDSLAVGSTINVNCGSEISNKWPAGAFQPSEIQEVGEHRCRGRRAAQQLQSA